MFTWCLSLISKSARLALIPDARPSPFIVDTDLKGTVLAKAFAHFKRLHTNYVLLLVTFLLLLPTFAAHLLAFLPLNISFFFSGQTRIRCLNNPSERGC